jgi:hypothetical protein
VLLSTTPTAPTITRLSPTAARRGATITTTGKSFGKKSNTSLVKLGARRCTKYVSWSVDRIGCKVPSKAKSGKPGSRS